MPKRIADVTNFFLTYGEVHLRCEELRWASMLYADLKLTSPHYPSTHWFQIGLQSNLSMFLVFLVQYNESWAGVVSVLHRTRDIGGVVLAEEPQ